MADLTQEEWAEQLKNDDKGVIIDVRTDAEFEEGHIPEAKQIDIYNGDEFLKQAKELADLLGADRVEKMLNFYKVEAIIEIDKKTVEELIERERKND